VSFGYTVLGFGGFANRSTPLAASFSSQTPSGNGALQISYSGGATSESSSGDLDFTVTPSGGSGSYTYSWSLVEVDDPDGVISIYANGTTNGARYQNGRLRITANVAGGDPPPQMGMYQARCVISDGVDSVTLNSNFSVELA
jgi:hypothetical protein